MPLTVSTTFKVCVSRVTQLLLLLRWLIPLSLLGKNCVHDISNEHIFTGSLLRVRKHVLVEQITSLVAANIGNRVCT
jgi:hypothetical protein